MNEKILARQIVGVVQNEVRNTEQAIEIVEDMLKEAKIRKEELK
jgi:proline dehydrogenase|tara:strand:+ start:972 stop:1103 length:132 start_codon:yes stop_codon:yes gene_type:complete